MNMVTDNTSCPVVRRNIETFHQSVYLGGVHSMESFERPILWIQESETRVLYLHGGKVLHNGPDYGDYYGYLTSFINRNEDDDKTSEAKTFGITCQSTLEMQLVTRIHQIPMIETDADRQENASRATRGLKTRQYTRIPEDWRKEMACEHSPSGKYYPGLEKVMVVEVVTWSSKRTKEENQAFAADFIQEWAVEQMPS
ncbi:MULTISPECIES: hypothetical protein [Pseudomonas]|uniref:hypothetical protein n=1 Tax=Pseudomonas TaxID=286 RepID=UPI001F144370|nr:MULTISPECIES: hypothetical protein [Pseudomonas]